MKSKKILVIGAGIAGLAAAKSLTELGFKVQILEARNRVGGRIFSVSSIDMGAQWIHGTEGNPLTNLVHQLSIPIVFVGGDSTYTGGWEDLLMFHANGKKMSPEEKWECILLWDKIHDQIDILRENKKQFDYSMKDILDKVFAATHLTQTQRHLIQWHVNALVRDDCGTSIDTLSAQYWDEGFEVYGYGDSVFPRGYQEVAEKLAIGLSISLETEVIEINYTHKNYIQVITNTGEFVADQIIITVPLGVLKKNKIKFNPGLPLDKLQAIRRLEVGCLAKVVLLFEKPFWPLNQYVFGFMPSTFEECPIQIVNLMYSSGIPALTFMIGGKEGEAIENWSDQKLHEHFMKILKSMFGNTIPLPKQMLKSNWMRDPFSFGAYCVMNLGATPSDIENLAKPMDDRIFFAGEATSNKYWGTVHAAYITGLLAGSAIAKNPAILPHFYFTENRRWRNLMLRMSRFFAMKTRTMEEKEILEIVHALKQCHIFTFISDNELRQLAMMFEKKTFLDNEIVCEEGDYADRMYVIASGQVLVSFSGTSKKFIKTNGDVVGEYGIFTGSKRTATLTAKGVVEILYLDYTRFERFLLAFPESMYKLFGFAVRNLLDLSK